MYTPASCDNQCKGCQMNKCGWCSWKDTSTLDYDDWAEFRKPITSKNNIEIWQK